MPAERLHKVLAHAGVASRRAAEELIRQGRVSVDGRVVTELGLKVDPAAADIRVDGERIRPRPRVTWAVYKPRGVVTTTSDRDRAPKVIDLVHDARAGRLYPVGRLDKDSEGLVLLTNDGALAQRLTHPRHGVPKTYRVWVRESLGVEELGRLREGVWSSDGKLRASAVRIHKRGGRQVGTVLEVVLRGGKNRQLRRMLAALGCKVRRLVRIAIGPVTIAGLKPGRARRLRADEVRALARAGTSGRG